METILGNLPNLYKIDKFYCIPISTNNHTSGAISLNWKMIPQFGRKIL